MAAKPTKTVTASRLTTGVARATLVSRSEQEIALPKYKPAALTSRTPLGARVRRAADALNLTMSEVAEKCKVNRTTLYRLLSGRLASGKALERLTYWMARNEP